MFGGKPEGGWRQTRSQKQKGRDYSFESQINLIDVFLPHKRTFNINGKNIRITVPAGVENGQTIKITGHGAAGTNGGQDGDLFLTFVIAEDDTFKLVGKNLFAELEIDFLTAVLGGEIIFETLNGKVKLKIKDETQNESKLKLKNKGLPAYKNEEEQGYLQINIKVKMPQNLTKTQKDLFEKLSEIR
jgi:curved DNA-binding protein